MKSTGIVRRIDELGRVVIPKEQRRTLHIKEGDPLELFVDGDFVCFKKYNTTTELFKDTLDDLTDLLNEGEVSSCLNDEEKVLIKSIVDLLKKRWEDKNNEQ